MKIFNKAKFLKNAPKAVQKLLSEHLDILDGMEVDFKDSEQFGIIPQYFEDGQEYYLYPVYKGWCEEKTQMELKDFI